MNTLEIVCGLLWERVPPGYDIRQSGRESRNARKGLLRDLRSTGTG